MAVKKLRIFFESLDDFATRSKRELKGALKSKRRIVQKKDELIWSSVEAYQQFMSDQKYAILAAIRKYAPPSVYQLAKILGRAQQNVARDCELLAGHGFIRFEESNDKRGSKAPMLIYDYSVIEVHLPRVMYKVAFDSRAA